MFKKILFVMMLLFGFSLTMTQAQSISVTMEDYQPGSPFCVNTYIPTIATIDIVVDGTGTLNSIAIEAFYNGVRIGSTTPPALFEIIPFTVDDQSFARTFLTGEPDIPDNSIVEIIVTAFTDNGDYSTRFFINCSTLELVIIDSTSPETSDNSFISAPDSRLNWRYGDSHIAILYAGNNGTIHLYDYESDLYIYDFFTVDDIPATPPDENLLIRSFGLTSVYILTTGQIQFNLGPDAEGKIWVFIMDDLSDRDNLDSYYIPPPE